MTPRVDGLSIDAQPRHGRHRHNYYAMTCEEFDELWTRAGGRCEICRVSWRFTSHEELHIDHNPRLGDWAVRGLLCSRCNTMLGTPGRLSGPEVNIYLDNPWRTSPPRQVTLPDLGPDRDPNKVFGEYRAAVAERNGALLRLRRGVYQCSRSRSEAELVQATGLTRERIRQIIAAEERRREHGAG